jgi:Mn-containing catalase
MHLLTREITHAQMVMAGPEWMGKLDHPYFGTIKPDETVDLVFNLSKGGDHRRAWNNAPQFRYGADPKPMGGMPPAAVNLDDETRPLAAE